MESTEAAMWALHCAGARIRIHGKFRDPDFPMSSSGSHSNKARPQAKEEQEGLAHQGMICRRTCKPWNSTRQYRKLGLLLLLRELR